MKNHFDVIVIGSGIGGLVAALTCARAKRSVLLLEAGKQFGGYTNPFARKHFHFDPGIHYIGEAGPGGSFRHLLDRLGLSHVRFTELDPDAFDRYVFPDYEVANCVGLERFRDRLAADFPEEKRGLDRFFGLLADMDFAMKAGQALATGRSSFFAPDTWSLVKRAPGLLRWSRATLKDLLDHHFTDPRLKAAVSGPVGDLGLPPSRLAALMHLGVLCHYAGGAYFPAGGSGPLRDAFIDALKEEGAVLKRNARVGRILTDGERVTGVRLADGEEYGASTVISNAQVTDTYDMVDARLAERLRRKVSRVEHSVASYTIYMGVDGELDTSRVGSSNIWNYADTDIDATYVASAKDDFRENRTYFLTVPTNKDPEGGLAPAGKQTVELVTLCDGGPFTPWFDKKTMRRGDEYEQTKEAIADHFIALAEKHLPGLRDHLILKEVGTPATNYTYTLSPVGNIYGPAQTPAQIVPFRFGPKTPIGGLLLCGSSVMGAGIVPCASSGRTAGKLALKALREKPRAIAPVRWVRAALPG